MSRVDQLRKKVEDAESAFEDAEEAMRLDEPDLLDGDQINEIVDDSQAVAQWVEAVEEMVLPSHARRLKAMCEKALRETITLAELRRASELYEKLKEQLEDEWERRSAVLEAAVERYEEATEGNDD